MREVIFPRLEERRHLSSKEKILQREMLSLARSVSTVSFRVSPISSVFDVENSVVTGKSRNVVVR